MAICQVCQGMNLASVDEALMGGVSIRDTATRYGLSKSGVARHRNACLQPKLAAAARITAPAAEVRREVERAKAIASGSVIASAADILDLSALLARLARSLDRLEGSADTAANQNLHTSLAAVSGQLHRGIETAAKIQGLYAEPAAGSAGSALQISITMPAGQLPTPGFHRPAVETAPPPTLILDVTPRVIELALPPMPAGFKLPDFALTGDLAGDPPPARLLG